MQFWDEFEGRTLDGRYPLKKMVRSEGRSAWFETEIAAAKDGPGKTADSGAAIIGLTESLNDEMAIVQRLEAAKQVSHHNLIRIERVGRTELENTPLVYAVMEHTDQSLADAIRDHALTKEEVTDLAESMAGALAAIHAKGLVHTRVEPASILAAGETIKMRSDCLQAATKTPELSTASDVRGMGTTLFQALTQRRPTSNDDPEILRLPAPFAQVVRNALSGRWTLKEISTALRLPVLPFAAAGVVAEEPKAVAGIPADAAVAAADAPLRRPAQPVMVAVDVPESSSQNRGMLYAVVAIAIVLVLGIFFWRSRSGSRAQESATPAVAPATPPADIPAARPAVPPRNAVNAASPAAAAIAPEEHRPRGRGLWRVVAFTYNRQNEAEHKAREINQRHSDMQAEVFAPKGDRAKYLVALGGTMSREDAFKLREKARRSGLPRDTYAQNFPE